MTPRPLNTRLEGHKQESETPLEAVCRLISMSSLTLAWCLIDMLEQLNLLCETPKIKMESLCTTDNTRVCVHTTTVKTFLIRIYSYVIL
ncbi:hypothetical protein E2C01_084692 [Portunus trituberculatus]|uniref:Uncharacterized protein n=1 Tax=Portunus trituberculatus TaxID=210409 RepID=A0A5B7J5H9_PORTR|nr:hypothetical protein [Portunus trituberculatus]